MASIPNASGESAGYGGEVELPLVSLGTHINKSRRDVEQLKPDAHMAKMPAQQAKICERVLKLDEQSAGLQGF